MHTDGDRQRKRAQPRVNMTTPQPSAQLGQNPRKAQTVEARVMVLLGVASGHVGSEVGLPKTCSVQGVPEAGGGGCQQPGQALGEQRLQRLPQAGIIPL